MLILVSDVLFIRNFSAISAISAEQKIKDLSERLKQECRTRSWRCLLLDERGFSWWAIADLPGHSLLQIIGQRLIAGIGGVVVITATAALVVRIGGAGIGRVTARGWRGALGLRDGEILDIHERGLLFQHLRGEVVHICTTGSETEIEALDVNTEVEVLFLISTGALHREIERAEFAELYFLAFEELLEDTVLEFVSDTQADVFTEDGVVLTHVLAEFLIGHGLTGDHTAIVLAVGLGVRDLVLGYFNEYWHF